MIELFDRCQSDTFYATEDSAGFDICADMYAILEPGDIVAISTGLFIRDWKYGDNGELPALLILARSGLASKGICVANAPGLIDVDYKQDIRVILINHGRQDFKINHGDRIAQGMLTYTRRVYGIPVKPVKRNGGLGSTNI